MVDVRWAKEETTKKGVRIVLATGKRKRAIARAVVYPGNGKVWINGVPVEILKPEIRRWRVLEPLMLAGEKVMNNVNIKVWVKGGGFMAQAEAARMAIARGLIKYTNSEELKNLYEEHDRYMLSGDPRRTEPEKWMRYSARRRRQKSYR
ncbi:30S ribosomal protein S9 [Ignicoccus islandicus DSM 13165]|uniref:Small ribosomal subunit protein uS9 n=1 Tax=Ignicoccus islandicus DSM 13165 TaxID=940295 RepID=A0A0U3FIB5_9CREN|nr:30S ribosomal protein S9 [Ignicoccus islandicus]ALU11638.1 30S ribosomal protein S9 [Ignicoccus islandicus DSM 13165]